MGDQAIEPLFLLHSKSNQYRNLHAGRAYVNAKSILGIFSLDLSRPISVEVDENDSNIGKVQMLLKDLRKYRLQ